MAEGTEVETAGSRFRHVIRRLFSARARATTSLEYELRGKIDDLENRLARANSLLESQKTELGLLASKLRISDTEVEKLVEVVERDRIRVQAETAVLTRQIAESTR